MIGTQLAGRYEILERVGGGGMAIVYKGLDVLLNRKVAVKVLRQQYVNDEEFIQRFRREAQAAASLSHPNVVSIYDVGQEGETHYIVMEYVDGMTLNEIIKERAPLQVEEAIRYASQICDALDHAHHNQIIHRDIKPHNILIGKNGRVKVTDFGIARAVTASTITQTGSVVGSVHYFSPEHAKGISAGAKSDLYSLGIVLYQMLTGRLPFLGESPISVALKHLQENVEEPRKVNPLIPQSVENIILKAMRKNPDERYQSAMEMLKDLETCLLPERRNEAKVVFDDDDDDEEKTRVMPAIRANQPVAEEDDDDGDEPAEGGTKKRAWMKPTAWLGSLLLIVLLMWYLVGWVQKNLIVADVPVPDVVNWQVEDAKNELTKAHFKPNVVTEANDQVEKDRVIRQDPYKIKAKINSVVTLYVSEGPPKKKMPDYTGKDINQALFDLKQVQGLTNDQIKQDESFSDDAPGTVIKQSPAADEEFDPKTATVTLTVSKGKQTVKMPDLRGLSLSDAKKKLDALGLKLAEKDTTQESDYRYEAGKIIKQFPYEKDDDAPVGADIKVVISSGLPADAGPMTVSVQVKPAVDGKPSNIKISLTDARYPDGYTVKTLSVSKPTAVDVPCVVSPDKNAVIKITQDDTPFNIITKTYQDYLAMKSAMPATTTPAPAGGGNNSGGVTGPGGATNTPASGAGSGATTGGAGPAR